MPEHLYYSSACHVCAKAADNILRCSQCRTIAYCSKEHQKQDWPSHRKLCKVIRDTDKKLQMKCTNFQEFIKYRMALRSAWESELRRCVTASELLMTMLVRACAVCYSREHVYTCKECFNTVYCSKEHESEYASIHDNFCSGLKLLLLTDQYLLNYGHNHDVKFVPDTDASSKIPEDTMACSKYLKLSQLMENYSYLTVAEKKSALDVVKTTLVASGLSVLYGLQIAKIQKRTIVIHFANATFLELTNNWQVISEMLRYWLDGIQLTLYVTGTALNRYDFKDIQDENLQVKYVRGFYHQMVDRLEKPDLVVAFNCGFYEFEDQVEANLKPSVPMLLKHSRVPLLVTSCTKEDIQLNMQNIVDLGFRLNVLLDPSENPYAVLKPFRRWAVEHVPIVYANKYIFIVEKVD